MPNTIIRKWGLTHWCYVTGYFNELVNLRDLFFSEDMERLRLLEVAVLESSRDNFRSNCQTLINNIKSYYLPTFSRFSTLPLAYISAVRLLARLILIDKKLEQGCVLLEACQPYAIGEVDTEYLNPELFIQSETSKEIQDEYFKTMILGLEKVEPGSLNAENFAYIQYNIAGKVHACDYSLLWEIYRKVSRFHLPGCLESMLRNLEQKDWPLFFSIFLGKDENIIFLVQGNALQIFLNAFSTTVDAAAILLDHADILKEISKQLDLVSFFVFLNKIKLNQIHKVHPVTSVVNDTFQLFLLLGFDYRHCTSKIAEYFDNFRTESKWIISEALTRGDKQTATMFLQLTRKHSLSKRELHSRNNLGLGANGFFVNEKTDYHRQDTQYVDAVAYTLDDLLKHMKLKYAVHPNHKDLHFVTQLKMFIDSLVEIGLMPKEASKEFTQRVMDTFGIESKIGEESELHTQYNNRISALESEVAVLRQSEQLRMLEVTALKERVDQLAAMLSPQPESNAYAMK